MSPAVFNTDAEASAAHDLDMQERHATGSSNHCTTMFNDPEKHWDVVGRPCCPRCDLLWEWRGAFVAAAAPKAVDGVGIAGG